jgi:hypothetical protein
MTLPGIFGESIVDFSALISPETSIVETIVPSLALAVLTDMPVVCSGLAAAGLPGRLQPTIKVDVHAVVMSRTAATDKVFLSKLVAPLSFLEYRVV